jgi:hypothetical protein
MPKKKKKKTVRILRKPAKRRPAPRKPKAKPRKPARTKKPNHTLESVMKTMVAEFPVIKTTDMMRKKSWELLADKIRLAYEQETIVFCVTVNPDILENRERISEIFPCQVCSPTEGLHTGGFNYMTGA